MSDIRDVLDRIEKRANAATPGPWDVSNANEGMYEYGPFWMITNDEFHNPSGDEDAPWLAVEIHTGDKGDAEFIAHARTAVPALVAALRAVLKVIEDMPHDECEDSWYDCSQATDPYTGEFTCANDNRAGEPCDCTKQWLSDKVDNAIAEALGSKP